MMNDEKPMRGKAEDDYAALNWETIRSIQLHDMTVDELVDAEHKAQTHLCYSKGVWWEEVKPFFYHPVVPMLAIKKGDSAPNPLSALGGYYHFVPTTDCANGTIVVNEIPDLRSYALAGLGTKVRHNIRRGLRRLRIARVCELSDLLHDGYQVYMGWEQRHSDVRVKRSSPVVFERWIRHVHGHPHTLILGAYDGDRLVSFIIGRSVMGIANISKSFTHPMYYRLTPNTPLKFAFVTICQQNPGIQKSCDGLWTGDNDLAQFKVSLGYKPVTYPAFIHLPRAIRPLVKRFLPQQYRRLMGQYEGEASLAGESHHREAVNSDG